jgi:dsDNA-specific endonuclease/ATPase MutS2
MGDFTMNDACTRYDPITRAIYDALTAAEAVEAAFANAEQVGFLNEDQFEQVSDLRRGELSAENFSRENVQALRDLAISLEPAIRGETQTWFVHDECDMSGGHEESATTEQGYALIRLHSSLKNLADRLSDVVRLHEAVRLSESIVK